MQNKLSLGQLIKKLREERGVSLKAVEEGTGLSRSYINRLENSNRENPSLYSISKLVKYFGIPFSTMEEFCDSGNNAEGTIQNLDYILLNEKYLFANIEADIALKMLFRDLVGELESYCTKASVTRQDEAKILDLAVLLRENLLSA